MLLRIIACCVHRKRSCQVLSCCVLLTTYRLFPCLCTNGHAVLASHGTAAIGAHPKSVRDTEGARLCEAPRQRTCTRLCIAVISPAKESHEETGAWSQRSVLASKKSWFWLDHLPASMQRLQAHGRCSLGPLIYAPRHDSDSATRPKPTPKLLNSHKPCIADPWGILACSMENSMNSHPHPCPPSQVATK